MTIFEIEGFTFKKLEVYDEGKTVAYTYLLNRNNYTSVILFNNTKENTWEIKVKGSVPLTYDEFKNVLYAIPVNEDEGEDDQNGEP